MTFAVEIDNVTKTFGPHVAVDDLSLRVPSGSVYGFIGPNGSGKTTTLRMIMRILHPDRGHIRVLGEEKHGAANDRVGYLPEERGLYKQMKVRDLLEFYSELKGHRPTREEIHQWLARMFEPDHDPHRVANLKVDGLSKGMSQKVQFIATVIARPQLVLLDEPFSGLDPGNSDVLRQMVLELRRRGATIIFSTHDLNVAEQMCDSIFMIYQGRKVLDGTMRSIQEEHGRDLIHVRMDFNGTGSQPRLDDLPGVLQVTDLGNHQELRVTRDADPQRLLAALMARGRVDRFEIAHPGLSDLFRRITGKRVETVEAEQAAAAAAATGGASMRKILVIASREYLAAVKTKSFIISLILLPIMMSGGLIAQKLGQKIGDTSTKRVAVIDRTPGRSIYGAIDSAVNAHNDHEIFDNGRQVKARFVLEPIDPADLADQSTVDRQRVELSERVRTGELLAFVEIGPDLLKPSSTAPATFPSSEQAHNDDTTIRYTTNRPTYVDFKMMLNSHLPQVVFEKRLDAAGFSYQRIRPLLAPPQVIDRGLAEKTTTGKVTYESNQSQIASFAVPLALLLLMFIVVIVGASPMTGNVIEEKQLRIAEVLLGSVRPFELMMGKLLGGVGVAMTLAIIYFGGAYYGAVTQGMASYISTASILWFLFFTVLGTIMYGSMFVAAGAAVTNIKEAQSMIMPVMLLIMLPMFVLGNIIQDPSGKLATAISFFPFSAPMVMTARVAIPPGVPVWQSLLAAGIALVTTVFLVWAAGRIFRVGILMQGQGAKITEMAKWIVRG